MLIQAGALSPVPRWAAVPERAVADALRRLTGDAGMQPRLDEAFRRLELEQPELSAFVAGELSELEQPEAQALGYFLFMLVYVAFAEAFGRRMRAIEADELEAALAQLLTDGEVRGAACRFGSYSEDAIALGQPALMALVRGEVEDAAKQATEVDAIMQAALVEILALSAAVLEAA
jgi:hypothetical protein